MTDVAGFFLRTVLPPGAVNFCVPCNLILTGWTGVAQNEKRQVMIRLKNIAWWVCLVVFGPVKGSLRLLLFLC